MCKSKSPGEFGNETSARCSQAANLTRATSQEHAEKMQEAKKERENFGLPEDGKNGKGPGLGGLSKIA